MTSPQFSKRPCRPRDLLQATGGKHPGAWGQADSLRADRGNAGMPTWPDWCYLPIAGWIAIASQGRQYTLEHSREASTLAAVGAWRLTQGIYRFDPELYAQLVDTSITGDIPADVLYRLPEWCIYIEMPQLVRDESGAHYYARDVSHETAPEPDAIHGFFAHLEHDVNTGATELRLLLDSDGGLQPIALHLGSWSLAESVDRFSAVATRNALDAGLAVAPITQDMRVALAETAKPCLSLLLYLCSQNAEIGDGSRAPANPLPKRTKRGWRIFGAERVTTWDVGVRLGAALRRAYSAAAEAGDGTHAGPRGHIRRAHWHGFRSGAMKTPAGDPIPAELRRFDVRWLPPIPVNLDDPDNLPATIRTVKP